MVNTPEGIDIGAVIEHDRPGVTRYRIRPEELSRHVLVSGVTGAGKTNTVFRLLAALNESDVPFLVIEPAKAEYRALLADPRIGPQLQVFTLGLETGVPFRLNPFEVLPEPDSGSMPVARHLDLIRALFVASFGMWNPLPAVLERCLHRIYTDAGWDLTAQTNSRARPDDLPDVAGRAFPTLRDLDGVVDPIVGELGYNQEVSGNMRAALKVRIGALRAGGKGAMLDGHVSIAPDLLFERPTVLELEGVGDDDEKSFLIGLLLLRLAAYRRAQGETASLRHVLVVEEAHRLLRNVPARAAEGEANAAGKAVEAFTNLLAEVRAYGQGIVVADQTPIALAPAVLKNTGLKLTHRLVAADDREAVANATAMNPAQTARLATLARGQVAAFGGDDDTPVLLDVPKAPARTAEAIPKLAELRRHATAIGVLATPASPRALRTRAVAVAVADTPRFQTLLSRIVLSSLGDPTALQRLWPDSLAELSSHVRPDVPAGLLLEALAVHGAARLIGRWGATRGWSYAETALLEQRCVAMLTGQAGEEPAEPILAFLEVALPLFARASNPYPHCSAICPAPPLCLYRDAAGDLLAGGTLRESWAQAERTGGADPTRPALWNAASDAAYRLVEWPADDGDPDTRRRVSRGARRAALCYAQRALFDDPAKLPSWAAKITSQLVAAHAEPQPQSSSSSPDAAPPGSSGDHRD